MQCLSPQKGKNQHRINREFERNRITSGSVSQRKYEPEEQEDESSSPCLHNPVLLGKSRVTKPYQLQRFSSILISLILAYISFYGPFTNFNGPILGHIHLKL